jgi:hypothetical protein
MLRLRRKRWTRWNQRRGKQYSSGWLNGRKCLREVWVERERLAKAREEFESKLRQVDNRLERSSIIANDASPPATAAPSPISTATTTNFRLEHYPFHHHSGDAISTTEAWLRRLLHGHEVQIH